MELKDKLKKLRQEKGLTQAQLADAIFVSRSTVAKWENGLGLPNADSMAALEKLFDIQKGDVATSEPEAVIVQKNRKLHLIGQIAGWSAAMLLTVLCITLPFVMLHGNYGFTWTMAAGIFSDNPYFDTGDCRIYYTVFEGDWEDGRHWYSLSHFKVVERHFWGYTVWDEDASAKHIFDGTTAIGRFYSVKGKNGYYNMICHYIGNQIPEYIATLENIRISGIEYPIEKGFFFITEQPVEFFWVGEKFLNVE